MGHHGIIKDVTVKDRKVKESNHAGKTSTQGAWSKHLLGHRAGLSPRERKVVNTSAIPG